MTAVARGRVRLRPVPACDPPYDDERPVDWWGAGPAQQPLELALPSASPPRARPPTRLEPPEPAASPDATAAAARFVNTCLEILNGYRPVAHVRALARPLEAAAVLSAMTHAVRQLQPVVRRTGLVKLRAMRICEPRPGIAEIAVVIGTSLRRRRPGAPAGNEPEQSWGLAYRLERRPGGWQCTAAQLL